jgi:cytochrome P450
MWFDPRTVCFEEDPYPLYRRLRDEFPVYRWQDGERSLWILSRYDDVNEALGDWRTFSSVDSMSDRRPAPGARGAADGHQLITSDPPHHDDLRRVVREYFSPKAIQPLEGKIEREVGLRLPGLRSRETIDVAGDFAWPMTLAIISDIIGIPEEDRSDVLSWYQTAEYSEAADRSAQALSSYTDYFDQLGSERLARPRDDLISHLMKAVARADVSRPDALLLCKDLFEGGVDVPANLIANAVLALADHPHQRAYLADGDLARVRVGIEELARFDSPIQSIPRVTSDSIRRRGVVIPRGAIVLLMLGAANRDERRFADPDALDVSRPATRNVAFGAGVHFCIGAPLARLQARVALPELFAAIPDYEVVAPVERPRSEVMRALLNLELAVPAGKARVGVSSR